MGGTRKILLAKFLDIYRDQLAVNLIPLSLRLTTQWIDVQKYKIVTLFAWKLHLWSSRS